MPGEKNVVFMLPVVASLGTTPSRWLPFAASHFDVEKHRALLKQQHSVQLPDQLNSDCLSVLHLFPCQFFSTTALALSLFSTLLCHCELRNYVLFLAVCSDNQSLWVFLSHCLYSIELQHIPSVTHLPEKLLSDCFASVLW